jgi:hypothetical protein
MLDNNVIIPSQSPSANSCGQKEKQLYSSLHRLSKIKPSNGERFIPFPRINDSLDALRGNSWFSTLDLVTGYYQCSVDPQDAAKTAFATSRGLFQWNP